MATTYKSLSTNDIVTTKTLLHEAIPITGTIVSGTYNAGGTEQNIKDYTHGMFQSVYDYPYLSSSANHIFDLTNGYSANSSISASANTQGAKKINIYNQMAQVLMGYDQNNNIREFDEDGDLADGGVKMDACYFINFSRLITKDEIKKESFRMSIGVHGAHATPHNTQMTILDLSASTEYRVNSPAGEYGILYATGAIGGGITTGTTPKLEVFGSHKYVKVGLIYYQAGIAVLTSSLFQDDGSGGILDMSANTPTDGCDWASATTSIATALKDSEISSSADALRRRIKNIQFNNTTELNSTIYFCRANHNEFNYSANPTYLNASKIRVKNETTDVPVSYITTVGLYNDRRELLATAKLSEPLKKTPDTEFTLRVRLDY